MNNCVTMDMVNKSVDLNRKIEVIEDVLAQLRVDYKTSIAEIHDSVENETDWDCVVFLAKEAGLIL